MIHGEYGNYALGISVIIKCIPFPWVSLEGLDSVTVGGFLGEDLKNSWMVSRHSIKSQLISDILSGGSGLCPSRSLDPQCHIAEQCAVWEGIWWSSLPEDNQGLCPGTRFGYIASWRHDWNWGEGTSLWTVKFHGALNFYLILLIFHCRALIWVEDRNREWVLQGRSTAMQIFTSWMILSVLLTVT